MVCDGSVGRLPLPLPRVWLWLRLLSGRNEAGAGSVLGLSLMLGIATLALGGLSVYSALPQRNALQAAADSASLAGANAASGRIQGYPCDLAAQAAELNGAELDSCELQGLEVTVQVSGGVLGIAVSIASRAGPPPD